jgi:hypothetical protein
MLLMLSFSCMKEDTRDVHFSLKEGDHLNQEDYDIYCLILEQLFPNAETLVVNQETSVTSRSAAEGYFMSLKEEIPGLDTTLLTDFADKNDTSRNLDNKFIIQSKKVVLVTRQQIHEIFTGNGGVNDGWEAFYRLYPNSSGEIVFGCIGYNASHTRALVEMGNMYASLGGEGQVIYLAKESGHWKLVKSVVIWVS